MSVHIVRQTVAAAVAAIFLVLFATQVPLFAGGPSAGFCPRTADEEQWSSDSGPVYLAYGAPTTGAIPVLGTWVQAPGEQGCFIAGSYNPATGAMVLSYYQNWNNVTGMATLQMNSQGTQITGTWSQSNGDSGSWTMTRSAPSALFSAGS